MAKQIIKQTNINVNVRNPEDVTKVIQQLSLYLGKSRKQDQVVINLNGAPLGAEEVEEDLDLSAL